MESIFQHRTCHEISRFRAFLQAWKYAVQLIGLVYFKAETTIENALHPLDLQPDLAAIKATINGMKPEDQFFIAALLHFYDKQTAIELEEHFNLVERVHLDEQRKSILKELMEHYSPSYW